MKEGTTAILRDEAIFRSVEIGGRGLKGDGDGVLVRLLSFRGQTHESICQNGCLK